MVDPLLLAIAGMGAASLALMIHNMVRGRRLAPRAHVRTDRGLRIIVEGREYVAVAYAARGPPSRRASGEALARTARSMGLTVSFIASQVRLRKDEVVRRLEEEIQRVEMAAASTGLAKYRERLKFLESLYAEVTRAHIPYAASLAVIVWVPADKPEARAEAEAFRSLVEAELGVELEEVRIEGYSDLASILFHSIQPDIKAYTPTPLGDPGPGKPGVIIGRRSGDPARLVQLDWPRDLEAHGAVIGPTGRGKTVLLAGIAAQLAARLGEPVAVVDPKGDLARLLAPIADVRVTSAKWAHPASGGLVVYDFSGVGPRGKGEAATAILQEALEAAYNGLPCTLIVDEAWRALSFNPAGLEAAVREGRSLGLRVVYAVQSPSDLTEVVLENTRFYAVFGGVGDRYRSYIESLGLPGEHLGSMGIGEVLLKKRDTVERAVVFNFAKYLKPPRGRAA